MWPWHLYEETISTLALIPYNIQILFKPFFFIVTKVCLLCSLYIKIHTCSMYWYALFLHTYNEQCFILVFSVYPCRVLQNVYCDGGTHCQTKGRWIVSESMPWLFNWHHRIYLYMYLIHVLQTWIFFLIKIVEFLLISKKFSHLWPELKGC